jgi:hypothetical protein
MMKSKQKREKSIKKISKPKNQIPEINFVIKYNFEEKK